MIVRCPSCQTEFSLDDRQVGPEGATVRCSVCSHVFHVDAQPEDPADQPWQIRTVEDLLFTAPDLTTLVAWIREGRLHPDDEVSRTGRHWLALREMPEFASAFSGFEGLGGVVAPAGGPDDRPVTEEFAVDQMSGMQGEPAMPSSPTSMLDAVTQAVGQGHGPPSPAAPTGRRGEGPTGTVAPTGVVPPPGGPRGGTVVPTAPTLPGHNANPITAPAPSPAVAPSPTEPDDGLADVESMTGLSAIMEAPRRRPGRLHWGIIAGLGAAAAIAVVFAIPAVRNQMFRAADGVVGEGDAITIPAEVEDARRAAHRLDPEEMGRAEAVLQAKIDAGDQPSPVVAAMKLAQVDLLSRRAISASIESEVLGAPTDGSADHVRRAAEIFSSIRTDAVRDRASLRRVRATLRLAEGRDASEILPLLPEAGADPADDEIRAVVVGAPLWRDPQAAVPRRLPEQLRGLSDPGNLARLVLALAQHRDGDDGAALETVDAVLAQAATQPAAQALERKLRAPADPSDTGGTGGADDSDESTKVDDRKRKRPARAKGGDTDKGSGDGRSPTSIDGMIDTGCSKVEGSDVPGGIAMLERALNRRPGDVDILLCLGQGHAKAGRMDKALVYFERVLSRSRSHRSALRGAARAAERMGKKDAALRHYKRLLEVDPRDAKARAYVNANGGGASGGGETVPSPPPGGG